MARKALQSIQAFNELLKATKWQLRDGRWRTHGPSGNVIDTTPPGTGDTVVSRHELPAGYKRVDLGSLRGFAFGRGAKPLPGRSQSDREAKAKHALDIMQRFGIRPTESWLRRNKDVLGGIYHDVENYLRKLWAKHGKPEAHQTPRGNDEETPRLTPEEERRRFKLIDEIRRRGKGKPKVS